MTVRGFLLTGASLAALSLWSASGQLPLPALRLNRLHGTDGQAPGYILALQICLDRRGFSCNTLDGSCGRKTFRTETVTAVEHAALVRIPADPAGKSQLTSMGYQTIQEMYAERGHVSERMLVKLNPGLPTSTIDDAVKRITTLHIDKVEELEPLRFPEPAPEDETPENSENPVDSDDSETSDNSDEKSQQEVADEMNGQLSFDF